MSEETKEKISKKLAKPQIKLICEYCKNNFFTKKKNQKFCSKKCVIQNRKTKAQLNCDDFKIYRNACRFKFSLSKYPEKYDFSLVEKYGWYKAKNKGNNLNGVSRDHIISCRYGFDNCIPSWIISHPANCRLMRHNDNVSKGVKCDLTLTELLNKIDNWE